MIVGHLGLVAALARARPQTSLRWLIPAAVAPDVLDIALALVGVCNPSGLYTHTIPAALLTAAVVAGAAVLDGHRTWAPLLALVVLLHLPLDYVTGHKLFWPGGELHGLRLYSWPLADFTLETLLLVAGWLLLRGAAPPAPRWATHTAALVVLVLVQGAFTRYEQIRKPTACSPSVEVAL